MTYEQLVDSFVSNAQEANQMLSNSINFMAQSPFANNVSLVNTATSVVQGTALVVISAIFMIDFFSKTINISWIKWENVMMLFLKFIVAKVLVDNAPYFMNMIFEGFNGMVQNYQHSVGSSTFLPTDRQAIIDIFLSRSEQQSLQDNPGIFNINIAIKSLESQLIFIIIRGSAVIANVIIVGRAFELIILTIISPLPIACFGTDSTAEIGKNFIKTYIAVCLQSFMIVLIYAAYPQIKSFIPTNSLLNNILSLVILITALVKSGAWAKKALGMG